MKGSPNDSNNEHNLSFLIAGIYLVLIGVTGGVFNIIALVKACQVKKCIMNSLEFVHLIHLRMNYSYDTFVSILIQAKRTKLNLILINLIVSDLFIVFVGIPIDAVEAFSFGSALNDTICSCVAFTHTIFGNIISISLKVPFLYKVIWKVDLIFQTSLLNLRNEI